MNMLGKNIESAANRERKLVTGNKLAQFYVNICCASAFRCEYILLFALLSMMFIICALRSYTRYAHITSNGKRDDTLQH